MTIKISKLKNTLRFLAADVQVLCQNDAILRQRSGLVRTQDVHGAKVLNRIKALHDHLVLGHRTCALCQINRYYHRKHFRSEANRNGDSKQQCLKPIVLGYTVDNEDERPHHNDEPYHQPGESVDTLVERRWDMSAGYFIGELAKKCLSPGVDNQTSTVAAYDIGPHKADIRQVERIDYVIIARMRIFLSRHRLAS